MGCITSEGETSSHSCGFLNLLWESTVLLRRGYCSNNVCMARVSASELEDPNVLPLDCDGLAGFRGASDARSWSSPASEFSQDWYVLWNFLRSGVDGQPLVDFGGSDGVYVDVGANFPFEYSNTVVFDRCFGWRGLCIEPNKGLLPWLTNYRNCEVINYCVKEAAESDRVFRGLDGGFAFAVDCLSLDEILTQAGLRGKRIDLLSVDVEQGELGVLRGLSLNDYDIRVIVMEVSRGARWLEVDTEVLQYGYAKVAVLGRDVVYAKLGALYSQMGIDKLWRHHQDSFLLGYALEDGIDRSEIEAKAQCVEMAESCSGVTCSNVDQACTLRSGNVLYNSPSREVSHTKVAIPPIISRGSALMPSNWADFHQRVITDEVEAELKREKVLTELGLRRQVAQKD